MNRLKLENQLWSEGYERIMGLDEVGRGCLSGPVVAAGVVLGCDLPIKDVRDSKELSEKQRLELVPVIKKRARAWSVQECSPAVIDEVNILNAAMKAMQKCVEAASTRPDYLLVDGNKYSDTLLPHKCIVGGDDQSMSIGAASILAKVYRDNYMKKLHDEFPHYGWNTNVGYATKQHYEGLQEYGITKYHRRSFNLKTNLEYEG